MRTDHDTSSVDELIRDSVTQICEQIDESMASLCRNGLNSPNVMDRNLEPANLVDAISDVAQALYSVAKAIGARNE